MNLHHMDPTGLLGMKLLQRPAPPAGPGGALLLCASPSNRYLRGVQTHINNAVRGVSQVRALDSSRAMGPGNGGATCTHWSGGSTLAVAPRPCAHLAAGLCARPHGRGGAPTPSPRCSQPPTPLDVPFRRALRATCRA